MIPVTRLNHAVLFVRDLDRSVAFYQQAFGFEEIARERGMMAFLRANGSDNHHDLGLAAVGPQAPRPPRGSVGLYHLAWQVPTIDALADAAQQLSALGALSGASDHGAAPDARAQHGALSLLLRRHHGRRVAVQREVDTDRERQGVVQL